MGINKKDLTFAIWKFAVFLSAFVAGIGGEKLTGDSCIPYGLVCLSPAVGLKKCLSWR